MHPRDNIPRYLVFVTVGLLSGAAWMQSKGIPPVKAPDFPRFSSAAGDKCGYDEPQALQLHKILGDHWGYGYDSLLTDLQRWSQSPFITIDSIGASVQNRALWQLTLTDTAPPAQSRRTVHIHARTHPGEVQGWWVTNEVINFLLSDDPYAELIRTACVFYIIPMYNPDGVELEYPRENANGIDIESNWNTDPPEPEVAALRARFIDLMASDAPIEVALNMHSAYSCKRFFVYHDSAGTSETYTFLEQDFIGGVRSYFPAGIEPWNFFVTWTNGTPLVYPESWFWLNHQEEVMALTYEDMNCEDAGLYDSTAYALVHGIGDYLGIQPTAHIVAGATPPTDYELDQNYPNPFNTGTRITYFLPQRGNVSLTVYDLSGRKLETLIQGIQAPGNHVVTWSADIVPSGIFLYHLQAGNTSLTRKCVVIR